MLNDLVLTSRGSRESKPVLTVSELNRLLARHLNVPQFSGIYLRGQVTGITTASNGHWYFSLKDDLENTISCIMWVSRQGSHKRPHNGDEIIAYGNIAYYEKGGRLNFHVNSFRESGQGALYLRFLALKDQLEKEGLFDPSRKRPLPRRPRKIAMVTSASGAVFHDVCNVARGRDPGLSIVLVPAPVQGPDAAMGLAESLMLAAKLKDVEVIIVGRGGGSMEDLWCFNDERVVRAIAASPIPVVTGIGHETDTTLSDFAADVRASTPSHAAELVVFNVAEVMHQIRNLQSRMQADMEKTMMQADGKILRLHKKLTELSPASRLDRLQNAAQLLRSRMDATFEGAMNQTEYRLADIRQKLDANMDKNYSGAQLAFSRIQGKLSLASPEKTIMEFSQRLIHSRESMDFAMNQKMTESERDLSQIKTRLQALNPEGVLERGYAFVTSGEHVISRAQDAPRKMTLHFRDGTVDVNKVIPRKKQETEQP